jgi:hypothetical protein
MDDKTPSQVFREKINRKEKIVRVQDLVDYLMTCRQLAWESNGRKGVEPSESDYLRGKSGFCTDLITDLTSIPHGT